MTLNPYGDQFVPNASHGVDVSSQRLDDLDHKCLAHLESNTSNDTPLLLDLGCGRCGFSNRAAETRPSTIVLAVDLERFDGETHPNVHFLQMDMQPFMSKLANGAVDIVYSQRTLHYLPPTEAFQALQRMAVVTTPGGRLYLSASGLNSELSEGYAHRELDPSERFHRLAPEMAEKHNIREPVCLYTASELTELVRKAGFSVLEAWESDFGNCKLIAEVPGA